MFRGLRNAFVAGFLLLAPLGVTFLVIRFLLNEVGDPASGVFFAFLDKAVKELTWVSVSIQVVSTIVVILLITLLGYLSNYVLGKMALNVFERLINRVPVINSLYNGVKQIVETFTKQKKAVFQKTVLVEYPRKGVYAVGFLTGDAKGEVQDVTGKDVLNVFIPTTPNPTSGFLLMIPKSEVVELEMSIPDGMKLIISGGAVVPPYGTEVEAIDGSDAPNAKSS